jgi:hypothetical protein
MPNHISNRLFLKDTSKSGEIINKITGENFSFLNTVPRPIEEENDWYKWNCNNWGTKWDCYEVHLVEQKDNYAIIEFQTAWSPPTKWLKHIKIMFPNLKYKLVWSDEDFPSSGKITDNIDVYYSHDDEHAIKFVKKHFYGDEISDYQEYYKNIDFQNIEKYESDDDISDCDSDNKKEIKYKTIELSEDLVL